MKLFVCFLPLIALSLAQTPIDTASGRACILPFKYQGATYTSCTNADNSGQCWCAISLDVEGDALETENCGTGAMCVPKAADTTSAPVTSGCPTSGGSFCRFPFRYNGQTYRQCTTVDNGGVAWCATATNAAMDYTTYDNCQAPTMAACDSSTTTSFSYSGATGPDYWGQFNPNCDLNRQSPINIETSDAPTVAFKTLTLNNYNVALNMELFQNGHTVQMNYVSGTPQPSITGGPLGSQTYLFAQWHLHWGKFATRGSEHTIDSKRYPMEIHLVHYNARYGSLGGAVNQPDGLAVIGIMFDSTLEASCDSSPLNNYKAQIMAVPRDRSKTAITGLMLNEFIKVDTSRFYNYLGSLTTPPCSESVTWIVMEQTNQTKLCQAILDDLNAIIDSSSNHRLYDNWRPVQALNNRMAVKSF